MWNAQERRHFDEQGYLHVPGIVSPDLLAQLQARHDALREAHSQPWNQHLLLTDELFLSLIEHEPIVGRHRALFGDQTQLLQFDLLYQGPGSSFPQRAWHRDFSFPGDHPLSVNTILYLDDVGEDVGPTYVIPGSHRGRTLPPTDKRNEPLSGEVCVMPRAGDAVFINSAIWHSGSTNRSAGHRRTIYLYYGHWWLKRYNAERDIPEAAWRNASEARQILLGKKMPQGDLHIYTPTV